MKTVFPHLPQHIQKLCVPARKLYEYAKLLDNGDISLKAGENHWLQVSAGRSRVKMVGMDTRSFPGIPDFPGETADIPAKTLGASAGTT